MRLAEFKYLKQSYERSIEMTSGCSFIGIQKEMMDQVEKLEVSHLQECLSVGMIRLFLSYY